jgi:ketosteroid isomerase-like protein
MGSALVAHADPSTEVKAAFTRYDEGWRNFDVAEVLAAMAPEFEWTNSVGIRIVSKPQFETFLKSLFKNPRFRAGKSGPLVIHSIRMLGLTAAVVSSSVLTTDQQVWDTGKTVPALHTNELSILEKQSGRWVIVRDLTSDESHGI